MGPEIGQELGTQSAERDAILLGRRTYQGARLFPDGIGRLELKLATTKPAGPDGVQLRMVRRTQRTGRVDRR